MDRTESATRKLLAALLAPGYDVGVLSGERMQRFEDVSTHAFLHLLPYLKHRNASGAHIYFRPAGESAYKLLDDLTSMALASMHAQGFAPAAIIETSPGNFQAWLRHPQPLPKGLATLAAKMLAVRFKADPSAADWRRFGRAPGFTNRKPKHRRRDGVFPFAHLVSSSGQVFAATRTFFTELSERRREVQQHQALVRQRADSSRWQAPSATLSLVRFRAAPRYGGRPAAADMAFSICAYAEGWRSDEIADALRFNYLSRSPDLRRRDAYIRRTLEKAQRWVAGSRMVARQGSFFPLHPPLLLKSSTPGRAAGV